MKILYIHHCCTKGGSSNSLINIIMEMKQYGLEEKILCVKGPSYELFYKAGLNVSIISEPSMFLNTNTVPLKGRNLLRVMWGLKNLSSGKQIKRYVQVFKPQVVHLNECGMFQAARIAKNNNIPVLMHVRSVMNETVNWANRIIQYLANKYVDAIVAIDGSVARSLSDLKDVRIVYNPNRQDVNINRSAKQQDPCNQKEINVIFLANLMPIKGIWELMEAAKQLKKEHRIKFLVLGKNARPREFHSSIFGTICRVIGLTHDVEAKLKKYIEENSLSDNVKLLGYVEDFNKLLENVDINVFPSHMNGPSRSVFETGLYEIPTIISLKNKVEDVVEDGVTGVIIPEKDSIRLSQEILRLANSSKVRLLMGLNARRKYLRQFNPELSAKSIWQIYQQLISFKA